MQPYDSNDSPPPIPITKSMHKYTQLTNFRFSSFISLTYPKKSQLYVEHIKNVIGFNARNYANKLKLLLTIPVNCRRRKSTVVSSLIQITKTPWSDKIHNLKRQTQIQSHTLKTNKNKLYLQLSLTKALKSKP